jgi:superfamily II DNA or RNA helicase
MGLPAAVQEAIDLRAATPGHHPTIHLRPYQVEAKAAVLSAWEARRNRQMVVLPTGAGKTILFSAIIDELRGQRGLVIAHRDELIDQAREKLLMVDPGAQVGIVKGARNQVYAQTLVASIQTVSRPERLAALKAAGGVDYVIVDECHHAGARTYVEALKGLGCFDSTPVLGVTATPIPGDRHLAAVFPETAYSLDLLDLIDDGYLAPPVGVRVKVQADLGGVKLSKGTGDFDAGDLGRALIAAEAHEAAAHAYVAHAADRRCIVFVPTVELAQLTAEAFRRMGIPAESISGQTPRGERHALYRRLRSGETRVVTNAMLLTEGFDEPLVDAVMIARPTKSAVLYRQMVGRGLRLAPGKDDCKVIDLVDASRRTSLYGIGTMMGVPDSAIDGRTSLTKARREAAGGDGAEFRDLDGDVQVEAAQVDLMARFRWVPFRRRGGGGAYAADLGERGLLLLMENVSEDVEGRDERERWTAGLVANAGRERLTESLTLEWAQGVAEDHARDLGAGREPWSRPSWRGSPSQPDQRDLARSLGVRVGNAWTAGQVADAITRARAEYATGLRR